MSALRCIAAIGRLAHVLPLLARAVIASCVLAARAYGLDAMPVTEIAPGVYVCEAPVALAEPANDGMIANLGFVIGQDGVAIIDTGGSRLAGDRLLAAVRTRTDLPIRYVINTHMHPDHVLGNAAFKSAGAEFVGHHNLPDALSRRAQTYLAGQGLILGPPFEGTEIVMPTILVDGALDLDLGGRTLRIESWPTAHTNTDVTVRDLATDTWFLGDLLFVGHVPALDGRLSGWIRLLQDLRARPAARVVPGHGPASVPWPASADPMSRYLNQLESDIRTSIRAGETMNEAVMHAARSEEHAWTLFNEFNPRNATIAFHELEWE